MELTVYVELIAVLYSIIAVTSTATTTEEFCEFDTFNHTCGAKEVIVMNSARYGRMRNGRCLQSDDKLCHVGVLKEVDSMCSGRKTCAIVVHNSVLHEVLKANNCSTELRASLQVSFDCIEVPEQNNPSCETFMHSKVTAREEPAILPGILPHRPHAGSTCDWRIKAGHGQHIRLNLINFFTNFTSFCSETKIIITDGRPLTKTLCDFDERKNSLLYSERSEVSLRIRRNSSRGTVSFIIQYSAVGCADLADIPGTDISRVNTTTTVKCHDTAKTFFLSCSGNEWKGESVNCSKGESQAGGPNAGTQDDPGSGFPYGLLIVIGIGVALGVAVGICLLFGILFFLRRRTVKTHVRSHTTDPLLHSDVTPQESEDTQHCIYAERRMLGTAAMSKEMLCHHSLATLSRLPHHPAVTQLQPSKHQIYESTEMRTRTLPAVYSTGEAENVRQGGCSTLVTTVTQPHQGIRYNEGDLAPLQCQEADLIIYQSPPCHPSLRRAFSPTVEGEGKSAEAENDLEEMQTSFITFKPPGSPHNCHSSDTGTSVDLIKDSQPYGQIMPDNLGLECTCTVRPVEKRSAIVQPLQASELRLAADRTV